MFVIPGNPNTVQVETLGADNPFLHFFEYLVATRHSSDETVDEIDLAGIQFADNIVYTTFAFLIASRSILL